MMGTLVVKGSNFKIIIRDLLLLSDQALVRTHPLYSVNGGLLTSSGYLEMSCAEHIWNMVTFR